MGSCPLAYIPPRELNMESGLPYTTSRLMLNTFHQAIFGLKKGAVVRRRRLVPRRPQHQRSLEARWKRDTSGTFRLQRKGLVCELRVGSICTELGLLMGLPSWRIGAARAPRWSRGP